MPDIFDQIAPDPTPDIFDQVASEQPSGYQEPIQYSEDTVNSFQPVDARYQTFQNLDPATQKLAADTINQQDTLFAGNLANPAMLQQLQQAEADRIARNRQALIGQEGYGAPPPRDGEIPIISPMGRLLRTPVSLSGQPQFTQAEQAEFEQAVPPKSLLDQPILGNPLRIPYVTPPNPTGAMGFESQVLDKLSGFTSPKMAALAAALPGVNEAAPVLGKAISAYFGVDMGRAAISDIQNKNYGGAAVDILGAVGAGRHVLERPASIQVDPDLGIVKTPAGPVNVSNGVVQPLTPVEAQSAAALKGPEAVATTVTEPVTEPLKVAPALTPIEPDTFERESGETLEPNHVPYRDPTTLQVFQAPQDATPEQLQGIQEAAAQENAAAEARSRMDALDQSTDQARADAATRANFTQDENGALVPNPTGNEPASVSTTDAPLWQNPDRLEALKADILGRHAKAQNGMLTIAGERVDTIPNQQVQQALAAIDERLSQLRQPKTFPIPEREPAASAPQSETPDVSAPETPTAHPQKSPLEEFADKVNELAKTATDDDRFSGGSKVYIDRIWKRLPEGLVSSREDFNRKLFQAHQKGLIRLSRLDLVGAEPRRDLIDRSEIKDEFGEYHLVNEPETPPPAPPEAPTAAAPTEPEPDRLTSIKNAATDEERAARGISPVEQAASRDFGKAWDDSAKELSLNSKAGADLVTEILKRPRPLSDTEDALMLRRQIEVQKEQDVAKKAMEAASASGDEGSAQKASLAYNNALDELQRIYDAGHLAGTENGRGLNARKLAANQSYELGRMLSREQAAQGGRPLTPEEKAQVAEDHERIKKSGDALAEYTKGTDERASVSTAKETVKELQKEVAKEKPTRKPSNNLKKITDATRSAVDAQVKAALDRIKERSKKVYSNPLAPFAHIKDEVIIGAGHLVHGLADFADWSKAMVDQFGEVIRPKLAGILKQSKDFIDAHVRTQQIMDRIAERAKDGTPLSKMTHLVNEMAKEHVRTGITELDPLVKGLQDQLKAVYPDITERQTRDALSGYGNKQKLSTDPVDVTTRQLRGEALTTTQIEEYKSGRVPKATGAAHQEPSQRGRELIKEKNIAKKESGLSATDPERQLKTALDTKKTTLRNQIEDYETAIDKRQRIVRGKGLSPEDSETKALTARRDELKKQYDDIFQKPELTDVERIKRAVDATNRNHEHLKQQIESGKFVKGAPRKLTSPELDAAKALRDATKAQLEHLKSVDTDYQADQNAKRQAELQARYDKLDRRVKEGDIASKAKPETPEATPELQALKDQIDAKSKELTKLQNDAKRMTPAERLANKNQRKIKEATDAIAEMKRKINDKDLSVKSTTKVPGTPELEALRYEREDLGKQLQKMRNDAKPKADPEATKLKAQKTAIANRLAERTAKIAAGDFSKKVRTPLVPDADLQKLQKADADSKLDYERRLYAKQQLDRSKTEKFIDAVPKWKRTWVLSGASIIAKLQSAAAALHVITPTEDAIGGALGHIPGISEIAKDAPRHGRFVLDAQVHGLTQALLRQFKNSDFVSELKTGEMDIDRIYGKSRIAPPEWSEFMGHVHGALKSSVRRAEFERSFSTRMEHAARIGEDVTEPVVQTRVGVEAYKDANSSIFRQNNRLVDAYQRGLQSLVQADRTTGNVPISGRVAKAGLDYTLPIVRIPTNILARTLEYSFGSLTGGAKLAHALATGVEKLSPAEKDVIMRNLKRGSLGAGLMALGYFNPQNVGGFYQRGKQPGPNDPQFGGLRLFGHNIPRILIHNPLLETLQIGATIRKIQDEKTKKGDSSGMAFGEGAWAAAWGLAEETPVIGTPVQIAKDSERGLNYALTKQGEGISPLGLKQITEYFDKDAQGNPIKRNPQNFGEGVESGIPGLRQKVGVKSAPEPKSEKNPYDLKSYKTSYTSKKY